MEPENTGLADTWLDCKVCKLITNENTPELHAFIVEQSKKYPLAIIVQEIYKKYPLVIIVQENLLH